MIKPFHLSFLAIDKEETKNFYLETLDCTLGRDSRMWCDVIFFGHQITVHQASRVSQCQSIDHFGVILSRDEWSTYLRKIKSKGIPFIQSPVSQNQGKHCESGKFSINDPCGNIIEFKYYSESINQNI
ncbi:VOC family protein [Microbulbifer taiwanensis]|uniref:VOC family protein n=1 Tax=Microbulbifer taiwanensis TaxID=986746 RepID=A0ABW1YTV8_9GAMM